MDKTNAKHSSNKTEIILGDTEFSVTAYGLYGWKKMPLRICDKTNEFLQSHKSLPNNEKVVGIHQITPQVPEFFQYEKVSFVGFSGQKDYKAPISGLTDIGAFSTDEWCYAISGLDLPEQDQFRFTTSMLDYHHVSEDRVNPMTFVVAIAKKPTVSLGATTMETSELPIYAALIEAVKWGLPPKKAETLYGEVIDVPNAQTQIKLPFGTFYLDGDGQKVPFKVAKVALATADAKKNWDISPIRYEYVLTPLLKTPYRYQRLCLATDGDGFDDLPSNEWGDHFSGVSATIGKYYVAMGCRMPPHEYEPSKKLVKDSSDYWGDDYMPGPLYTKLPAYYGLNSQRYDEIEFMITFAPKLGCDYIGFNNGYELSEALKAYFDENVATTYYPASSSEAKEITLPQANVNGKMTQFNSSLGTWQLKAKTADGKFINVPFGVVDVTERVNQTTKRCHYHHGKVAFGGLLVPDISAGLNVEELYLFCQNSLKPDFQYAKMLQRKQSNSVVVTNDASVAAVTVLGAGTYQLKQTPKKLLKSKSGTVVAVVTGKNVKQVGFSVAWKSKQEFETINALVAPDDIEWKFFPQPEDMSLFEALGAGLAIQPLSQWRYDIVHVMSELPQLTTKLTLPFGTFFIEADGKRVPFEVEDVTDFVNQNNRRWYKKNYGKRDDVERAILLKPQLPEQFSYDKVTLHFPELKWLEQIDNASDEYYDGMIVGDECYAIGYGGMTEDHYRISSYPFNPDNIAENSLVAVELTHYNYAKRTNGNYRTVAAKLTEKLRPLIMFAVAYKSRNDFEWINQKKHANGGGSDVSLDFALDVMDDKLNRKSLPPLK